MDGCKRVLPLRKRSSTVPPGSTKGSDKGNVPPSSRRKKPKKEMSKRLQADSGFLEDEQTSPPRRGSSRQDGVRRPEQRLSAAESARKLKAFTLAIVPVDLPPKKPSAAAAAGVRAASSDAAAAAASGKPEGERERRAGPPVQQADRSGSSSAALRNRLAPNETAAASTAGLTADDEAEATGVGEPIFAVKQTYSRENKRLRFSLPGDGSRLSCGAAGDASTPAHRGGEWPAKNAALASWSGDVLSPIAFSSETSHGTADSGYASFDGDRSTTAEPSPLLPRAKAVSDCEPVSAPTNEPSKRRAKQTQKERLREWEERRCAELEQIEQLELLIE